MGVEAAAMRVLVTGTAGPIGSGIAALLGRAHHVTGVDLKPGPLVHVRADIGDRPVMARLLDRVEAVVHVAALHAPHVGRVPDADFRRTNVDGTERLLELALAKGVRRFVFTSSTSVYGNVLVPKDGAVWIDEAVSPEPRDIYDSTKLEAEALVEAASGAGLRTAILRMSRCFPEPEPAMAAYRLFRGIDRRDVARAHEAALSAPGKPSETYLISAATPFLREDCAGLLEDAASVIRARAPAVAQAFARRGWRLPASIDRVYSPAKAALGLGFRSRFGAAAIFDGDCDPPPAAGARPDLRDSEPMPRLRAYG